jgi:hypothetical protein
MKKGRNAAEVLDDDELDYMELPEGARQEMALVLKAAPPSWKGRLIAHGAKEIRCTCCGQIRPIAGAEDSDDGWICEFCLPLMMEKAQ